MGLTRLHAKTTEFLRTGNYCNSHIAGIAAKTVVKGSVPVTNDQDLSVRRKRSENQDLSVTAGSTSVALRAGNKQARVALTITAPSVTA